MGQTELTVDDLNLIIEKAKFRGFMDGLWFGSFMGFCLALGTAFALRGYFNAKELQSATQPHQVQEMRSPVAQEGAYKACVPSGSKRKNH